MHKGKKKKDLSLGFLQLFKESETYVKAVWMSTEIKGTNFPVIFSNMTSRTRKGL